MEGLEYRQPGRGKGKKADPKNAPEPAHDLVWPSISNRPGRGSDEPTQEASGSLSASTAKAIWRAKIRSGSRVQHVHKQNSRAIGKTTVPYAVALDVVHTFENPARDRPEVHADERRAEQVDQVRRLEERGRGDHREAGVGVNEAARHFGSEAELPKELTHAHADAENSRRTSQSS